MPTIAEFKRSEKFAALIYGKFKAGKTAGAATFPRPNFLDFDDGLATLTNPGLVSHFKYPSTIMYETFEERGATSKGVLVSHNALDDACRYFDACMNPKGEKYKSPRTGLEYDVHPDMFDTWVIDSGTTLSAVSRVKALILMGTPGALVQNKTLSQTFETGKKTGFILPKLQDFGAERSLVEQFIEMVLGSGKHVLLLCHEKEEWEGQGENSHVSGYVPLFVGQSVETIPLKFDEVYNLQAKVSGPNLKRILKTTPDGLRQCGSRLGLPDGTEFEWPKIKAALNL